MNAALSPKADNLKMKRVYDAPQKEDGYRILVDRLWPRGFTKERLPLDAWPKELTPSTAIRKAFGHMAQRFDDFETAYLAELDGNLQAHQQRSQVLKQLEHGKVTLLSAAHLDQPNHVAVLRHWLLQAE